MGKRDVVGVSRVDKGHQRWSVFRHVDNGAGASISVSGGGISHERQQGVEVVRVHVVQAPASEKRSENKKKGHGELAQPWSHGV